MHDEIKRFSLDGEIGDVNIEEAKTRMINFLNTSMRDKGYAPSLDVNPQFTLDFDPGTETFKFVLSVYGAHVGKEKACQASGVMNGKILPMPTRQTK